MLQLRPLPPVKGHQQIQQEQEREKEDEKLDSQGEVWDNVFDLVLSARKLEDAGVKVILYIKQEGRPLMISSHRGEEDLIDTLTELIRKYMQKK